ncbi:MAG: TetR/AcrR family transcriptional regulator [Peptococcaceae bacterium]|jgi:AcrR family transcriptional regulator|nr:TetR/AcrR family transcriptional regulator [Peptococcaceae bacterium]
MMNNVEDTEDLRVRRTRKLMQKALIELTIEKGFADITVHDITDRAMVNRSTFYRHFTDKYDLLDQFMLKIYELTGHQEEFLPPGEECPAVYKAPVGLVNLVQHVQTYSSFYRVMLGEKGDPGFTQKVLQYVEKRFRHLLVNMELQSKSTVLPIDLLLSYVSHAGIGAIVWWIENDQPCSPEQLATWLNQFSMADINHALDAAR